MKSLLAFLLLSVPLAAQTIAPSQIKPGSNGQVMTTTAGKTAWGSSSSAPVTSVFGRTGDIYPNTGDYDCAQVTGALCSLGTIYYQTVQDAGSDQAQRGKLNIIAGAGIGVSVADNPGANSTDYTLSASAPTATDYVWTFTSCANSVGQPSQCVGSTTLPGAMPSALYFLHCDVFQGSEPSVQFININTWPLPTAAGSTLAYHMVQPMQNGTRGGGTYPVVCNAHSQASPAFAINSFSGGQSAELGQTFVNPSFAAAYSVTPAFAQIDNTSGLSSPTVLTVPFTSATIVGSFYRASATTITFTLTATQGTTLTATQSITWNPRIFGGVGATGATSSVTASGTTAVLSTSDALASLQLGAETTGETLGTFSPSSQCIYLLLMGGSHTFVDNNTGFPIAMNAPIAVTFVNQYGVSVTMYLYQSTNPLFGSYAPRIAS